MMYVVISKNSTFVGIVSENILSKICKKYTKRVVEVKCEIMVVKFYANATTLRHIINE